MLSHESKESSSSEVSEYSDEEEDWEDGGDGIAEIIYPVALARDFPNHLHFAEDGDGVYPGLIDGVAQELVAVLEDGVLDIDGVARAVGKVVARYIDAVVMLRAQIEGVGTNLANKLSGLLCASAPDEGAEGDKR